ncbi:hypothetical protein PPROV_000400000 [Pycnococcus provasolii]|uniref:Uncharacterized protein n=1 Tax=Pycnococcus provasolii TaxID=41880 RepID=A0A830HER4_9CHLO|nr:hypothetical protein PPROV_000400000 [Pycnococcus provasolii]
MMGRYPQAPGVLFIQSFFILYSMSSKLESFLYKLMEKKKLQLQEKEKEKEASSSASESNLRNSISSSKAASVYGSKAYWDKRYRLGPLGDGSAAAADVDDENPKHDIGSMSKTTKAKIRYVCTAFLLFTKNTRITNA